MTRRVVGIDVGGTTVKLGVVDDSGAISLRRQVDTPRTVEALVATIQEQVRRLRDEASADPRSPATPEGVGVVVPGIVDEASGTAVHSVNLGWRNVPFRAHLQSALGLPVAFGHDVRAGALAESRWGAGDCGSLLFIPLGTGIAAALVLDGMAHAGGPYAGEIGQVLVRRPSGDGRAPLERIASASAVASRFVERRSLSGRSTEGVTGARKVVDLARRGDPDAIAVLVEAADALAEVLASAVALLGSVRLVIAGGLGQAGELLLGPLRTALSDRLNTIPPPTVVPAALGPWAGCLGAGALALDALGPKQLDGLR